MSLFQKYNDKFVLVAYVIENYLLFNKGLQAGQSAMTKQDGCYEVEIKTSRHTHG